MSELDSSIKWKAVGLNGHSEAGVNEFLYTSAAAPVEAEEYERMTARAYAGERALRDAKAQLNAVPVETIKDLIEDIPVDNWTRKPLAKVKKWLKEQEQVHP